jgi:hypothetical protein
MVTINAGEPFTFPRAYIRGFAIFAENVTASLEGPYLVVINELLHTDLRLYINREVYPARSRSYLLDEFFIQADCSYVVEGLTADLTINVSIDTPKEDTDFRVCIKYSGVVEAFSLIDLPAMPSNYWNPDAT